MGGFSDEDFSDEGFLSPDPSINTSSGPSHARKSKKTRKRRARKSKMKKSRSGRSSQQPKCQGHARDPSKATGTKWTNPDKKKTSHKVGRSQVNSNPVTSGPQTSNVWTNPNKKKTS